jgi:hypothetical protein
MQKLIMVALMTFSATAAAGYHYAPEVYASTTRYHRMTYSSAWGTLAGAAASSDENQYIGCTTSSYTYDGVSTNYGYCVAVDADWNSATCYTDDPAQMAAIAAINSTSYVLFSATDGVCTYVSTNNTSWTL